MSYIRYTDIASIITIFIAPSVMLPSVITIFIMSWFKNPTTHSASSDIIDVIMYKPNPTTIDIGILFLFDLCPIIIPVYPISITNTISRKNINDIANSIFITVVL